MKNWKSLLLASALSFAAPCVQAQTADAASDDQAMHSHDEADHEAENEMSAAQRDQAAKENMQRRIAEMVRFVEELYSVDQLPPIDETRLVAARQTGNALIQREAVENMMENLYGRFIPYFLDRAGYKQPSKIADAFGITMEQAAALSDADMQKIVDIADPQNKEREQKIKAMIQPAIDKAFSILLPAMQEGAARAYARRFSAAELADLNGFLATPTGKAYAVEALALQADPEIILAMVRTAPQFPDAFEELKPQLERMAEQLPAGPKEDLSDADLRKIAKILKVDFKTLKAHLAEQEQADTLVSEAAEGTEMAALSDTAQAYDRDNWSPEWRARVEALETASQDAQSQVSDAETQAIEEASARLGSGHSPE